MTDFLPQVLFAPEGTGSSGGAASDAGSAAGGASSSAAPASSAPADSGGSAASSPAVTSSPSGASPTTPSESPDPFAILGDDSDSMFEIPASVLDVGAAPPVKEVVVPPVQAAEAKPDLPVQQPPAAVVAPPSPSTSAPQGAVSPHLDTTDPAAMANVFRQNEKALVDAIAQTQFALSPEDVEAYETDPSKFAATMAAKTFVRVQTAMMNQLAQMLPRAIERHLAVTRVAKSNEEEFFKAWPQLSAEKHRETVMTYAKLFRAQNPGKSKAEMIQALGPVVMMAAGVPLSAVAPVSAVAHSGNGVRPPQPSPFVPAVGGPAATPQQTEANPWDILGQD